METEDKDVMALVDGVSFHCQLCHCNVFRHPIFDKKVQEQLYICNSCGALYRGTPLNEPT